MLLTVARWCVAKSGAGMAEPAPEPGLTGGVRQCPTSQNPERGPGAKQGGPPGPRVTWMPCRGSRAICTRGSSSPRYSAGSETAHARRRLLRRTWTRSCRSTGYPETRTYARQTKQRDLQSVQFSMLENQRIVGLPPCCGGFPTVSPVDEMYEQGFAAHPHSVICPLLQGHD